LLQLEIEGDAIDEELSRDGEHAKDSDVHHDFMIPAELHRFPELALADQQQQRYQAGRRVDFVEHLEW
jgi:hypothetical protein